MKFLSYVCHDICKDNYEVIKWRKLYDGTVDYAGYICADIDDFEYSAAKGSIAVNIDASEISSSCSIGVGEWLTAGNDMVFKNKSRHGDSPGNGSGDRRLQQAD